MDDTSRNIARPKAGRSCSTSAHDASTAIRCRTWAPSCAARERRERKKQVTSPFPSTPPNTLGYIVGRDQVAFGTSRNIARPKAGRSCSTSAHEASTAIRCHTHKDTLTLILIHTYTHTHTHTNITGARRNALPGQPLSPPLGRGRPSRGQRRHRCHRPRAGVLRP